MIAFVSRVISAGRDRHGRPRYSIPLPRALAEEAERLRGRRLVVIVLELEGPALLG